MLCPCPPQLRPLHSLSHTPSECLWEKHKSHLHSETLVTSLPYVNSSMASRHPPDRAPDQSGLGPSACSQRLPTTRRCIWALGRPHALLPQGHGTCHALPHHPFTFLTRPLPLQPHARPPLPGCLPTSLWLNYTLCCPPLVSPPCYHSGFSVQPSVQCLSAPQTVSTTRPETSTFFVLSLVPGVCFLAFGNA